MENTDIDISKLIDEIAALIDSDMIVCLNVDTGEIVYSPVESGDPECADQLSREYIETMTLWDNKVEIPPVDSDDEYEIMEYFISDNVREGTRLYQRLTASINSDYPVVAFNREIVLCKGENLWSKYRASAIHSMVVAQIVETIGMPHVKKYPLNLDTIYLMAQAHMTKHYFYVTGRTVIISQVVYHTKIDPDTWEPIDDNYTIWEWAVQRAEEKEFYNTGGGLVYEPMGMYDEEETLSPEGIDIDQVVEKIKSAVRWRDEQERDFDDFCAIEQMVDDLWDTTTDYPDDYDGSEVTFVTPSQERSTWPDGKYPIHGKPDDEFSEDDPWVTPEVEK